MLRNRARAPERNARRLGASPLISLLVQGPGRGVRRLAVAFPCTPARAGPGGSAISRWRRPLECTTPDLQSNHPAFRDVMSDRRPEYLLFCDVGGQREPGRWRFVLRSVDGTFRLEADDLEPQVRGQRLELLTVVRGLEALDRPSRVTLITASAYVREGIRTGLAEWQANGWRWECFGQMVPVKNADLWQRIARALEFHEVDCRTYRLDPPHGFAGEYRGAGRAPAPPGASARRRRSARAVQVQGLGSRLAGWLQARLRGLRAKAG